MLALTFAVKKRLLLISFAPKGQFGNSCCYWKLERAKTIFNSLSGLEAFKT